MSLSPADEPQAHDGPASQYTVVARRYRPQDFEQLVGQQHVAQGLQKAIDSNRVGHAYLFTGARGVGKTSTARILAKALNCGSGPTPQPCGECDICQSITAGEDIDVLEIDGASNRGIDEVRQLRSNVNIRPSRARYKIYIIDEVHMLTTQAFNALLKTLEEPPEHVKFIFCTTEPEKIPITVLSRCQKFDFAPVGAEAIAERLRQIAAAESVDIDDEALATIARRAGGSVRDSQSLLEQLLSLGRDRIGIDDVHHMLGTARTQRLMGILGQLAEHDAAGALAELDAALGEGVDCGQLADQLLGAWRDLMAIAVGAPPEILGTLTQSDVAELQRVSGELGLENVLAAVQVLDEALVRMRQSPHVRIVLETALVRIAKLADLELISRIVEQLRSGGSLPAASGPPANKKKLEPAVGRPAVASMPGPSSASAQSRTDARAGRSPAPGGEAAAATTSPAALATAAVPTAAEVRLPLSPQSVESVWKEALARLGDMTADYAAHGESLENPAPGKLVVTFPAEAKLSKTSCEQPDRKSRLQQAVRAVTGQEVELEFVLNSLPVPEAGETVTRESNQRQLQREALNHPLVEEVRQLFDADIVKVTPPGAR